MDMTGTDVSSQTRYLGNVADGSIRLLWFSDVGSGTYEPVGGQPLPPPATNYGATGGR